MKLHWLLVILYTINVVSSKDYYDPHDEDDKVILWKGLFTKLNTLLVETDQITQNLLDLNKRQEDQGSQIQKLMDYLKESRLEFKERHEDKCNQIKKLEEYADLNTKYFTEIRLETIKRQEEQENKITNIVDTVNSKLIELKEIADLNAKYLNDSRSDYNKRQDTQVDMMKKSCKPNQTWTTILRRQDGSVNFTRSWDEYKAGFGDPPNGEFFIGLDKLHEMTTGGPQELMVVLKDWNDEIRSAHYDLFEIGGENEKYALKELGKYSGDAEDSFGYHKGAKFTTIDQDNDTDNTGNCAQKWEGAWWFDSCYRCHLNGRYREKHESLTTGVSWNRWKGQSYSFKFAEMKMRPKSV